MNDTFHHQLGDRRSVISRSSANGIAFGPLAQSGDVNVWCTDDDLVLGIRGTTEQVTVPGWFADNGSGGGCLVGVGMAFAALLLPIFIGGGRRQGEDRQ